MTNEIMMIDEAIKHCEDVAEEKEQEAKEAHVLSGMDCIERAKEYRQFAKWLKELKAYRGAREEIIRKRDSSQWSELVVHGFSHAIYTIDNHLKEVNADDRN